MTNGGRAIILMAMTSNHVTAIAATARIGNRLGRLRTWIRLCWERDRQRRALSQLSDYYLRDIGVTREEANAEVAKLPWR